jgi:hypothetical protein
LSPRHPNPGRQRIGSKQPRSKAVQRQDGQQLDCSTINDQ